MRAWRREHEYMASQTPKRDPDPNNEAVWEASMGSQEAAQDAGLRLVWDSTVPGSYAKERVIVGAVQAMENRGYLCRTRRTSSSAASRRLRQTI